MTDGRIRHEEKKMHVRSRQLFNNFHVDNRLPELPVRLHSPQVAHVRGGYGHIGPCGSIAHYFILVLKV